MPMMVVGVIPENLYQCNGIKRRRGERRDKSMKNNINQTKI
jgi:hypothetical protein